MVNIYIAGPLFTEGERFLLEKIDLICKKYQLLTYLPHRDAGLFKRDEKKEADFFFENDIKKLIESDIIIAVLNGQDSDSGTSWEMGYGYARNKRIIGYINDIRVYDPKLQLNAMVGSSLDYLVTDLNQLEEVIQQFK